MKTADTLSVLVLDIDGTIVTSQKCIDDKTKKVLLHLQEHGIHLILASGRPPEGAFPVAKVLEFKRFGGYIVAFNGAKVIEYRTRRCIYERLLPGDTLRSLWHDAKQYGLGFMTYGKGTIVVATKPDSFIQAESQWSHLPIVYHADSMKHMPKWAHQCLLTGKPTFLQMVAPILSRMYLGKAEIFHSEPECLEVTPCRVDKSVGLTRLFCHLGISWQQVVCCGDSYNDIGMIRRARIGIAMANAPMAVKKFADYITQHSNDEQGVIEVVNRFFPAS